MTRRSRDARRHPAVLASTSDSSRPPIAWPIVLGGVAVLAASVRLVHVRVLSDIPLFAVLLGDSKRYVEWASDISAGNWLGSGAFYQAPLYPYTLAVVFRVFGVSIEIVRVVQALAGGLSCVLVASAGRHFFGWKAGLVGGIGLALYPPAIFFDGHIQKASLDLLLMATALLAVAAYQSNRRNHWLVLLGVALGGLALNRESARLLLPFIALWLLMWNRDRRVTARLRAVGVLTLGALLLIAPVAIRNYYVAGEMLLSTYQLGSNFYIGNHRGASGVYEPLVPDRANVTYEQEDAVTLATVALGRSLSPNEVSSFWLSRALDEIRDDVGGWARLMVRKLALALNTVEAMDTESIEFHAAYSPILQALAPLTFGVLLPLAVFGIAITTAHVRRLAVLYVIGLVFLASVVVFFVLARYRYPLVPILALFAGAALAGIRGAWRERPRQVVVGAACALVAAVLVNIPIRSTTDETCANFGTELLRLERPGEAVPLLVQAVNLLPGDAAMHRDLALAYLKSGDPVSAVREYTTVLALEPDSPANHRELAVAAEAAGDRTAALASLREAVRLEPSNAATYVKLGDLFVRLDRPIDARRTYEAGVALKASPVDAVGLRVRLASLDSAEGRVRQAIALLEEAAATARSGGQGDVANDVEATIQVLRSRLTPGQ